MGERERERGNDWLMAHGVSRSYTHTLTHKDEGEEESFPSWEDPTVPTTTTRLNVPFPEQVAINY